MSSMRCIARMDTTFGRFKVFYARGRRVLHARMTARDRPRRILWRYSLPFPREHGEIHRAHLLLEDACLVLRWRDRGREARVRLPFKVPVAPQALQPVNLARAAGNPILAPRPTHGWEAYADGALRVLSRRFVSSQAAAINDLDQTAGRVDSYAAFWEASGKLHFLNTLKGFSSGEAQALNIHGVVVGYLMGNNSSGFPVIAFIWDGTRVHDMNALIEGGAATGWTLQEADGINDAGVVVGMGMLNGRTRAFVATPVSR